MQDFWKKWNYLAEWIKMDAAWLRLATVLAVFSIIGGSPSGMSHATRNKEASQDQQKPHIVVILADDLVRGMKKNSFIKSSTQMAIIFRDGTMSVFTVPTRFQHQISTRSPTTVSYSTAITYQRYAHPADPLWWPESIPFISVCNIPLYWNQNHEDCRWRKNCCPRQVAVYVLDLKHTIVVFASS